MKGSHHRREMSPMRPDDGRGAIAILAPRRNRRGVGKLGNRASIPARDTKLLGIPIGQKMED
jgi:hypothetical protein